jgi:hypothetical protein
VVWSDRDLDRRSLTLDSPFRLSHSIYYSLIALLLPLNSH